LTVEHVTEAGARGASGVRGEAEVRGEADPLVALCRAAADPALGLVIAGEGNAAMAGPDGTLRVTASGARLADCDPSALVEVRPAELLPLLDGPPGSPAGDSLDDASWAARLLACRVEGTSARPSVETALHAVVGEFCGATLTLHTHPTALLGVLCSPAAEEFARRRLLPDQIVLTGTASCLVPYVDPGARLARAVRDAITAHRDEHGTAPSVVLLRNHGMIAAGSTPRGVLDATLMTVKAAAITAAAAALGGARFMPQSEVDRIESRDDEHYRRMLLGVSAGQPPHGRPDPASAR